MTQITEKTARRIANALERIADQMPPTSIAPASPPAIQPIWRVPLPGDYGYWPRQRNCGGHNLPPDRGLSDNVRCEDKEDTDA